MAFCLIFNIFFCHQLIEQALVIEEQLRKSYSENPALVEKPETSSEAVDDKLESFEIFIL